MSECDLSIAGVVKLQIRGSSYPPTTATRYIAAERGNFFKHLHRGIRLFVSVDTI